MLEKQIETKVCSYAKSLDFLALKFTSPQRAAVPDRLFIHNGLFFFIEFKAPGNMPTPAQIREHIRIRDAGGYVFVVDSIDKGRYILDMVNLNVPLDRIFG